VDIIHTTSDRRGALTVDSPQPELDHIDGQKPSDHCAVVGYIGDEPAYPFILSSLKTLQHRGQESAGIATFHASSINARKGMGLVGEVFNERTKDSEYLLGNVGIGHTRYSTAGSKAMENAGPFLVTNTLGHIALSHNGEITNADRLRDELLKQGLTFLTSSDTEVLMMELARDISVHGLNGGVKLAADRLKGAYAITFLINDKLYAMRDPLGIRPLIIGKMDSGYIVASESCALDINGATIVRDVKPGELVEISRNGITSILTVPGKKLAHCMFEYVYFARPDSIIDNKEVFQSRLNLGKALARESPVDADVVFAVPDSGRAQALGYAQESGIPYSEGLIKNRFSDRTFIMPTQQSRTSAIRLKLNVIQSEVKDKRIILVDDSIIRGNTMNHIVALLRKAGAREVHVRIGCPPVVAPCFFGVDMKTKDQFVATGRNLEEICKVIGADSLGYVSVKGLVESIGMGRDSLCLGCVTGEYPSPVSEEKYPRQKELESFTP
jgi:amidophosphoribosyltransferase